MSGADRHSFFHGFCTNDIKGLNPGTGCEAFLCNVKGRILGHVFVFADEEEKGVGALIYLVSYTTGTDTETDTDIHKTRIK